MKTIIKLNLDSIALLPERCRDCGYWESNDRAVPGDRAAQACGAKAQWCEDVLDAWGTCGQIIADGNEGLAYCQYAPSAWLPQLLHYDVGPADANSVLLSCLYVSPEYRGQGLGKLLINGVQKDLLKRGYKFIETVTRRATEPNPSGWTEFYLDNGWQVVKKSGPLTLLRMDLRTAVTWSISLDSVFKGMKVPVISKAPASS